MGTALSKIFTRKKKSWEVNAEGSNTDGEVKSKQDKNEQITEEEFKARSEEGDERNTKRAEPTHGTEIAETKETEDQDAVEALAEKVTAQVVQEAVTIVQKEEAVKAAKKEAQKQKQEEFKEESQQSTVTAPYLPTEETRPGGPIESKGIPLDNSPAVVSERPMKTEAESAPATEERQKLIEKAVEESEMDSERAAREVEQMLQLVSGEGIIGAMEGGDDVSSSVPTDAALSALVEAEMKQKQPEVEDRQPEADTSQPTAAPQAAGATADPQEEATGQVVTAGERREADTAAKEECQPAVSQREPSALLRQEEAADTVEDSASLELQRVLEASAADQEAVAPAAPAK